MGLNEICFRCGLTMAHRINPACYSRAGQSQLTLDQKIGPLSEISSEITESAVEKATGRYFKRITDCPGIKLARARVSIERHAQFLLWPRRTLCAAARDQDKSDKKTKSISCARSLSDEIDLRIKGPFVMNWRLQSGLPVSCSTRQRTWDIRFCMLPAFHSF